MPIKPGAPGYGEAMDRQGHEAMDRALAHPAARVFCGALFLLLLAGALVLGMNEFVREDPLWLKALFLFVLIWFFAAVLLELGSVVVRGRSLTPWIAALVRRFRAKMSIHMAERNAEGRLR